jgi:hypothetical protein
LKEKKEERKIERERIHIDGLRERRQDIWRKKEVRERERERGYR